jgi:uracil-DNA glycosylase
MIENSLISLVSEIKQCTLCQQHLPLGPRPVLQVSRHAKILIAGQAPGLKVHKTGVPFDDASGERLRQWMNINKDTFYDAQKIAILPMGFCYPGRGKSGDLPPRSECALAWRKQILSAMGNIKLILVIGAYAQNWHMKETKQKNLTETVRNWNSYGSQLLPLPHPSPRNNIWLSKNTWFERDLIPELKNRVKNLL